MVETLRARRGLGSRTRLGCGAALTLAGLDLGTNGTVTVDGRTRKKAKRVAVSLMDPR